MDWKVWRRRIKIIWVTAGLSFTAWIVWNMQAHGVPAASSTTSATVAVTDLGVAMTFLPTAAAQDHPALVFIAGGMVDPDAYVPFARGVAEEGWPVGLVRLPWRMAFSEKANIEVWRRVNHVRASWGPARPVVIGGHSLGGALASRLVYRYRTELSGLLLVGTTHPKTDDLSSITMPVLKISGTRDCVADLSASQAEASKLPSQTVWTTIVGANHAQFGYYGTQLGDCGATISREEQQRQLREEVLRWLGRLEIPTMKRIMSTKRRLSQDVGFIFSQGASRFGTGEAEGDKPHVPNRRRQLFSHEGSARHVCLDRDERPLLLCGDEWR